MSGQCTGWVLRHGPKDRAMRMVLLTIADAANRDGEHAYPGMTAICEGSLYARSHVQGTLRRLTDEGWLEVEAHERGGRGLATVYRVVMAPDERAQPSGPLPNRKGPTTESKGPNPDAKRAQSEQPALITTTDSTVNPHGDPPATPPGPPSTEPRRGTPNPPWDALVVACGFNPQTKREKSRFGKAVAEIREALDDGRPEDDLTPLDDVARHIEARARRYREQWPESELTPEALVKHWSRFAPGVARPTRVDLDADNGAAYYAHANRGLT